MCIVISLAVFFTRYWNVKKKRKITKATSERLMECRLWIRLYVPFLASCFSDKLPVVNQTTPAVINTSNAVVDENMNNPSNNTFLSKILTHIEVVKTENYMANKSEFKNNKQDDQNSSNFGIYANASGHENLSALERKIYKPTQNKSVIINTATTGLSITSPNASTQPLDCKKLNLEAPQNLFIFSSHILQESRKNLIPSANSRHQSSNQGKNQGKVSRSINVFETLSQPPTPQPSKSLNASAKGKYKPPPLPSQNKTQNKKL
jgi:hypothetical protein